VPVPLVIIIVAVLRPLEVIEHTPLAVIVAEVLALVVALTVKLV
jgi:hypothetical protein